MTAEATCRQLCEGRLAIAIAGGMAAHRARQGSAPGWRRLRSERESIAFHEAGHAVVAQAVQFHVHRVFLVSAEPGAAGISGACVSSFSPDDPVQGSAPAHPKEMTRDSRNAAEACVYLAQLDRLGTAPTPVAVWKSALAYYREAKARVRQILDRNWYVLIDLAERLERNGDLNRAEVAGILAHNGL